MSFPCLAIITSALAGDAPAAPDGTAGKPAVPAAVEVSPAPTDVPAIPTIPVPSPDPPAVAVPAAPATADVPAAPELPDPEDLYLLGLASYKQRRFPEAREYAAAATNADPLMGEAWLLRSYVHMLLDEEEKALASVRLARASEREDVRAAARGLEARLTQVYIRNSPTLWSGGGPQLELNYGSPRGVAIFNFGVGVPLLSRLSGRAEVRWTARNPGDLHVSGTRLAALASWAMPIGKGRWSLNPSAGPALWIATGNYWADGANPYLGAQAQMDLDVRLTPAFGLFLDASTQFYPAQAVSLSWLAAPVEAHTGMRFWFWAL